MGRSIRVRRVRVLGAAVAALVGAWLVLALPGCAVATPMKTTSAWRDLPREGADLTLALTFAELDPRTRAPFDQGTARMFEQLSNVDGLLAYSRRKRLFGDEVWTLTVWRDDAAHDAFVASPLHREARKAGRVALVRTKFAIVSWPRAAGLPVWSDALSVLDGVSPTVHGSSREPVPASDGR